MDEATDIKADTPVPEGAFGAEEEPPWLPLFPAGFLFPPLPPVLPPPVCAELPPPEFAAGRLTLSLVSFVMVWMPT